MLFQTSEMAKTRKSPFSRTPKKGQKTGFRAQKHALFWLNTVAFTGLDRGLSGCLFNLEYRGAGLAGPGPGWAVRDQEIGLFTGFYRGPIPQGYIGPIQGWQGPIGVGRVLWDYMGWLRSVATRVSGP